MRKKLRIPHYGVNSDGKKLKNYQLLLKNKLSSSGSGEHWSTAKVKAKLVAVLKELVQEHQERRNAVTDEVVKQWMTERSIL